MNINRVILTGNLTRDPELKGAGQVCALCLAVNTRRKSSDTGEWVDQPNYFDVSVFGAQGESCARYLSKGRAVAVDGRLRWREWTTQEGQKRQAVDVVAETVQFLSGRDSDGVGSRSRTADRDAAGDTADFDATPVGGQLATEDDIPF
jgi:single-strand DNA-binding protein